MSRSFLLTTLFLTIATQSFADNTPPPQPLLIKNVTVIDGTGSAPFVASVLIEGDKISKVIKGDLVPVDQASVIDGQGKFLIPGFVDTSAHISTRGNISGSLKDFDNGELDSLYRDIQEKDAQKRLAIYKQILRQSLLSGVTTLVDSVTSVGDVAVIRDALSSDQADYPNFYSMGPILGYKGGHPYPTDATVNPQDPNTGWKYWLPEISKDTSPQNEAAAMALLKGDLTKFLQDDGLAGLTVVVDSPAENGHSADPVTPVPLDTLKTICDVAHSFNRPVFFISYTDQGIQDAAKAGASVKLGAPIVFANQTYALAQPETLQALASNAVQVVSQESGEGGSLAGFLKDPMSLDGEAAMNPTLASDTKINYDNFFAAYSNTNSADPERPNFIKNISAKMQFLTLSRQSLVQAHGNYKIAIIPSGDEGSAFVFHGDFPKELALLNSHGAVGPGNVTFPTAVMTPSELISTATLKAARTMRLDSQLGSIESGKLADMLLLDANPLNDINNVRKIVHVIKSGKLVKFDSAN